jgi:hypothetical protein
VLLGKHNLLNSQLFYPFLEQIQEISAECLARSNRSRKVLSLAKLSSTAAHLANLLRDLQAACTSFSFRRVKDYSRYKLQCFGMGLAALAGVISLRGKQACTFSFNRIKTARLFLGIVIRCHLKNISLIFLRKAFRKIRRVDR